MERLFLIIILVLLAILLPFTYLCYLMVSHFIANKPSTYRWPQFSDFWITGVSTLTFMILERVFDNLLYPLFYPFCKEKADAEMRIMRTKKAVKNIFKLIYYSSATVLGWLVLRDSYILPP